MAELLLSYYGDDLTGSTDVMEALASRGVPTVLFMRQPTPAQRARFSDVRAIAEPARVAAADAIGARAADACHRPALRRGGERGSRLRRARIV